MFRNNVLTTRRETTDIWESQNPVLDNMEPGVEIVLNEDRTVSHYNIKLGDGVNPWNGLSYFYEHLNAGDTDEILDDFTINLATRKPVANRIPIYDDDKGLKSGKEPAEDDDVVRLKDLSGSSVFGTDTPEAGKLAKYNEDKGLKSGKEPDEDNDVIRKTDLDSHKEDTSAHSATDTPAASKIAKYNGDLGLKSGKVPSEDNDVMRFLEFNSTIAEINSKISTLNGAYYVLDAYNFGKTLDISAPDDVNILNTYAIANTPGAASMADVYDNTVIINEFDTSEFVYNKISELWVKYPNGYLTIATNDHLGVVKGTQPPADPDDESKDTYVQVLADGTLKLVGDRLGKVNTVDDVAPDSNKNIALSVPMTKAQHDALEDPPGSGKYPSLAGKTVTLTDVYPKNTRRIPMPDYANMESTNRINITASDTWGSWTSDRTGYVSCGWTSSGASSSDNSWLVLTIEIGGKTVWRLTHGGLPEGNQEFDRAEPLQILKGQVIRIYMAKQGFNGNTFCYFIPIEWVDVEEN